MKVYLSYWQWYILLYNMLHIHTWSIWVPFSGTSHSWTQIWKELPVESRGIFKDEHPKQKCLPLRTEISSLYLDNIDSVMIESNFFCKVSLFNNRGHNRTSEYSHHCRNWALLLFSLRGRGWKILSHGVGHYFQVFSTIQGKTMAKPFLPYNSNDHSHSPGQHMWQISGPWPPLQVLQTSGSMIFMLRVKNVSALGSYWRSPRKKG